MVPKDNGPDDPMNEIERTSLLQLVVPATLNPETSKLLVFPAGGDEA
jgi:hypothetical protein